MYCQLLLSVAVAFATAQAPPPPLLLTATKSGVDPIVPTPFSGVETIEGAITNDGPSIEGFTGPGGNASIQTNLPVAAYRAVLPSANFDNLTGSTIRGFITGTSTQGGKGVVFTVNFTGFPSEGTYGPFIYHVHALPVPADGNCTATLGHLDPTNRGELHACEVAAPQTCQAGDLSGKHGNITSPSFTASYSDLYLSTNPNSPYFFGDKSIVIHSMNTTRLACANFVMVSGNSSSGAGGMSASTSSTGTSSTGTSSPIATFTGAATRVWGYGAGVSSLMGIIVIFFL